MPTRRLLSALTACACIALLGACGDDDDGDVSAETPEASSTTSSTAAATEPGSTTEETDAPVEGPGAPVVFTAVLTGDEEIPGPGVADGTGQATLSFEDAEVCYQLNVAMGEQPTAAHIHQGAKGTAGDVVVDLEPSFTPAEATHQATGCATPEPAVLESITANPAGFYVNVHTEEFPAGAVRGQLAPKA